MVLEMAGCGENCGLLNRCIKVVQFLLAKSVNPFQKHCINGVADSKTMVGWGLAQIFYLTRLGSWVKLVKYLVLFRPTDY